MHKSRFVTIRLSMLALAWQLGAASLAIAQSSDQSLELTLRHPRPESQSRWRIPKSYIAPFAISEQTDLKSVIVLDAVLPNMNSWRGSGLENRPADQKRHVSIELTASYDFGVRKRILPWLLKRELEFVGEYQRKFLRYRLVHKNDRGDVLQSVDEAPFYLIPKELAPEKTVYFSCVKFCLAHADFSETVVMKYGFALDLIGDWESVDDKVRELLSKFLVP